MFDILRIISIPYYTILLFIMLYKEHYITLYYMYVYFIFNMFCLYKDFPPFKKKKD